MKKEAMWGSLGRKSLVFKNHWTSDFSAVKVSAEDSKMKVVDVYLNSSYSVISLDAHQTEQMPVRPGFSVI